jgi:hypothetical protein
MKANKILILTCIAIVFILVASLSFMYGCRLGLRRSSQDHLVFEIGSAKALHDGKTGIALTMSEDCILHDCAILQETTGSNWILRMAPGLLSGKDESEKVLLEAAKYIKSYPSKENQETLKILQNSNIKDKIK